MRNPWVKTPLVPPYVLDEDEQVIFGINEWYSGKDQVIQTQLLPEPYIGNPKAPIIVLTKNPGFDKDSDPYWHTRIDFQKLMRVNLSQEDSDYPFVYFNSALSDSPGTKWHKKSLNRLIRSSSVEEVANKVCSIPYFPYHTASFSSIPKGITREILPSQSYTQYLVQQAINRGAIIVITLFEKKWKELVEDLRTYPKAYSLKSQNTMISKGNMEIGEFSEILSVLS